MQQPITPEYLSNSCAATMSCRDAECVEAVKWSPSNRAFITMGHAGFNSPANNVDGYSTAARARAAIRHYQARGAAARERAALEAYRAEHAAALPDGADADAAAIWTR